MILARRRWLATIPLYSSDAFHLKRVLMSFAAVPLHANVPAIRWWRRIIILQQRCLHGAFRLAASGRDYHHPEASPCSCFFSVWLETLGLSAIEAMANGVPVIVSGSMRSISFRQECQLHFHSGRSIRWSSKYAGSAIAILPNTSGKRLSRILKNPWTLESHTNELLSVYERSRMT